MHRFNKIVLNLQFLLIFEGFYFYGTGHFC